jgi:universal stress protein A
MTKNKPKNRKQSRATPPCQCKRTTGRSIKRNIQLKGVMKIKPSKLPGNVVMEVSDRDSECLSKSPMTSPFILRKILVPVDFSNCSKKALQYAVPLAKQFNGAVILLNVVPCRSGFGREPAARYLEPILEADLRSDAARKLKELAGRFVPFDIPVEIETCFGTEAVEIANAAKKLEADIIVISTHGRTGRAHEFAGSVTESLVQLASCPVLVVREHEHDFVREEIPKPFSTSVT